MAQKKRHPGLTIWLSGLILVNLFVAFIFLVIFSEGQLLDSPELQVAIDRAIQKNGLPEWYLFIGFVHSIFNVIWCVALFNWKKWGFWGYVGSAVAVFMVDRLFDYVDPKRGVAGLIFNILVLYAVLNFGEEGENEGWSQLE
ncbi:MAG: hypothetical protein VKK04_25750 [Synechococcales bacterium]|nr:hypothetical protein [Synechococcales bacterium]